MPDPDATSPSWKEPALIFSAMLLSIGVLSALSTAVPLLGDWLLLIAALIFIGLPYAYLTRRGEDLFRFGIDLQDIPLRHIGLGLLTTLIIFPLFAVGFHLWQTQIAEREAHLHLDNLRHWSDDLDAPRVVDEHTPGLQIRAHNQHLYLHWVPPNSAASTQLETDFDRPWRWQTSHSVEAESISDTSWMLTLPDDQAAHASLPLSHDVDASAGLPRTLSITLRGDAQHIPVYVGQTLYEPGSDATFQWARDHWWLLLWGLTHLLLVALPEEYFYRGYLQTRLGDLLHPSNGHTDIPPTFLGFTYANWATSACFAVGHVLIPVGGFFFDPTRAAVFFPSLIFGRLKYRTQSIIAPTVFHAGANMMILVLAPHYLASG